MAQAAVRPRDPRPHSVFRAALGQLKGHARGTFRLNKKDAAGITLRAHLEKVEEQTGKPHPELAVPALPPSLSHLWKAFQILNASCPADSPIAYAELLAYSQLIDHAFTVGELDAIKELEALYWTETK